MSTVLVPDTVYNLILLHVYCEIVILSDLNTCPSGQQMVARFRLPRISRPGRQILHCQFPRTARMESVSRSHLRAREDSGKLWVNKIVGPFMSIRRAKSWWIQLRCLSGPSMIVLQLPILQSGRVQRTPGVHSMCASRKFWLGWFTFGPLVCRSEAWTRSVRLPNGKLGQLNHTWLVVWNMNFMTFHILGISSSQLTFMFFHILGFHHPN